MSQQWRTLIVTKSRRSESTKIGDEPERGDEELEARSAGEAVRRPEWSGTGLAGAADERLCLPDSAGGREGQQGFEMGQRGRAQDAPEAAQGEADQAHRRDGVDVRLPGHDIGLQQVDGEAAALMGPQDSSQHLAELDPNSERFLLRLKPLGDLTKKKKKKKKKVVVEEIPYEPPRWPKKKRYR